MFEITSTLFSFSVLLFAIFIRIRWAWLNRFVYGINISQSRALHLALRSSLGALISCLFFSAALGGHALYLLERLIAFYFYPAKQQKDSPYYFLNAIHICNIILIKLQIHAGRWDSNLRSRCASRHLNSLFLFLTNRSTCSARSLFQAVFCLVYLFYLFNNF